MKGFTFKTESGCKYYYNDKTGYIYPLVNGDYSEKYDEKYKELDKICEYQPKEEVTVDRIKKHLYDGANGFRQLILEVASGCNLRCKYCIYSEHYPTYKTYTNQIMTEDTALKAVDYYLANFLKVQKINPTRIPNIGFYGGEPLLNFEVIKKVVEYANKKYNGILYHITTNGLLLNEEVRKFLVENDFSIIVSLDGDKENHDRNRVTPEGNGSFDLVFENIQEFRKQYPEYDKFGLSLCYDFKSNFKKFENFINDEDLFVTKMSLIDAHNTTYYTQFTKEDYENFIQQKNSYEEAFKEASANHNIDKSSFLFTYLGVDYSEFAFHSVYNEKRPSIIPNSGTCIPGEKLYISVDGKIHTCEKINSDFYIGDVNNGLNYDKIVNIIKQYNDVFKNRCDYCNVSRFCNICFAQCCEENSFVKSKKSCIDIESSIKEKMTKYVSLLEYNPGLFDEITLDYYNNLFKRVGGCFEL
jgi:uncharacterized protein